MSRYSMGIDFGTLSGRAVIVDIDTGAVMAESVLEYAHGVMSESFVDGSVLPADYALQHPKDYLDTLFFIIKDCLMRSGVDESDIVGVGVDFTASTVIPVKADGTPLCFIEKYKNNKHAYVKLWKHHAAQSEADEINALARERGEAFLKRYGGTISCEWLLPKVLNILREDEELYRDTDRFIEAGDWIVWQLTGKECHSNCIAGFKGTWCEEEGYPENDFLIALDKRLDGIVGTKLSTDISKLSSIAGYITDEIAAKTGLKEGTPVAVPFIDAHGALPALGVVAPGDLLMIIGTSTCHILVAEKDSYVPGISGSVKDGIVDGLYAFEAGQACVGDGFDWFVKNCVPSAYRDEAKEQGISIHKYLREKAKRLPAGSGGLLALDWWNGNRTPYVDGNLSGVIVGLTTTTPTEAIYRALIEATAYGTRRIIEIYEQNGIKIDRLYAAGGIAEKDEMLMQIYADVTGREIRLSGTSQACAYGSAVLGSVNKRGYSSLVEASEKLKQVKDFTYKPIAENTAVYDLFYSEYVTLSEYFAKGESRLMEKLKSLK